jgi:hypothetical protein
VARGHGNLAGVVLAEHYQIAVQQMPKMPGVVVRGRGLHKYAMCASVTKTSTSQATALELVAGADDRILYYTNE